MKTRKVLTDSIASYVTNGIESLFRFIVPSRCVHRQIAQDVNVDHAWTSITPSSAMKINRKFQAVNLKIDGLKCNVETDGLYLPSGTVINPELKISDVHGNWYSLEGGSMSVRNYDHETSTMDVSLAAFKSSSLPNAEFETVMIRSDVPFTCADILWTNYNMK